MYDPGVVVVVVVAQVVEFQHEVPLAQTGDGGVQGLGVGMELDSFDDRFVGPVDELQGFDFSAGSRRGGRLVNRNARR